MHIRFEVLVGRCCYWCRTVCEETEPVEGVTALTDFLLKKSRSGLLSSSKGGSKRDDSTLFGRRISIKEIKTQRESRGNLFLREFLALKKSRSKFCWASTKEREDNPFDTHLSREGS